MDGPMCTFRKGNAQQKLPPRSGIGGKVATPTQITRGEKGAIATILPRHIHQG